ncbi:MAG: hypothetical protein M1831_006232 [Alyxoria varia]|nr:MAG: hypothetical protein M1831_006232 [Alyxoria varia]
MDTSAAVDTVLASCLPKPKSLELAKRLDQLVRENGGIPAPIGVLEGVATVGLSMSELEDLVQRPGNLKISRRDLGFALSSAHSPVSGGTTVAGTMILAHLAGIKVFATGGLGGVHRGGQDSLDISADLTELGRTPVAVVSSGCKGFLDIPRTLEYLETQGVGVATFKDGREGDVDFPAFWSRDSECKSPMSLRDEVEAAGVIHAQSMLPLSSGLLLANPVPEEFSIPREELDEIIAEALQAAEFGGATGSKYTPYVLDTIRVMSGGRSVEANRALVESNVRRGTRVAIALSIMERDKSPLPSTTDYSTDVPYSASQPPQAWTEQTPPGIPTPATSSIPDILVAGSIALDTTCTLQRHPPTPTEKPPSNEFKCSNNPGNAMDSKHIPTPKRIVEPIAHTSNPSTNIHSAGGVGLNIARSAAISGARVKLFTVVGDDFSNLSLQQDMRKIEAETSGNLECVLKEVQGEKTASYVGFNDANGGLWAGMADMRIFERGFEKDVETAVAEFKRNWTLQEVTLGNEPKEKSSPPRDSADRGSDTSLGKVTSTEAKTDTENAASTDPETSTSSSSPHNTSANNTNQEWLVADANWSATTLHQWLASARTSNLLTAYEPVSVAKCTRIFSTTAPCSPLSSPPAPHPPHLADLATPNVHELEAMYSYVKSTGLMEREDYESARKGLYNMDELGIHPEIERRRLIRATSRELADEQIPDRVEKLLPFVPNIAVKLGPRGVLFMRMLLESDPVLDPSNPSRYVVVRARDRQPARSQHGWERKVAGMYARLFPPPKVLQGEDIVSVNGAGDTFMGALVAGLVREGGSFETLGEETLEEVVMRAQRASAMTLGSSESVCPEIARLFR